MHHVQANGVMIVRTPKGIGVMTDDQDQRVIKIEVDYDGKRLDEQVISSLRPWRNYYWDIDNLQCVVRVKHQERVLAELDTPESRMLYPFMVAQGIQQHITESSVAVPPALTITDERGDIWTLGFETAPEHKRPHGEFAFEVLRNGKGTNEIASRIEKRNGKVKIFTRHGWKTWNPTGAYFF